MWAYEAKNQNEIDLQFYYIRTYIKITCALDIIIIRRYNDFK